jgi:hypothetical protein
MDATITYVMMVVIALLMAMLPFGIFMGFASLLGSPAGDIRILITYILSALILSYLTAFGAFALIQKSNCGSVKNISQISQNAGISFGIQAITLFLCWLFPSMRNIVSGLLPPDLDTAILDSVGYSYYSFWASLFGTAIGGTLSGICM